MNPLLSPWSSASALVIYVHYILSFSQQTWTADYSLPLCSTLPCIWIILCFFFNIFLDQATRLFPLFPWTPRNHYLWKPQSSSSRPSSLSSRPHAGFRPNGPKKKGANDKNRNLSLLPPLRHMGRKSNGHIHSSSPKKSNVLCIQHCCRQHNSRAITDKRKTDTNCIEVT